MKNLFLKSLIALSVLLSMLACTKEGLQGPAGKDGNANVMYSNWITFAANFTDIATNKTMRVVVPQYTDNFVDSGGFYLAFVRWQNNVHYQLPLSQRFNSTSSPIVEMDATGISFDDTGELRFAAHRQDFGNLQTEFTTLITTNTLQVRYFLIRGTQNLRLGNGLSIQDYYKSKSYEEICALTGAPL
jgi:hypothetical protein